jgi:hypothetical protein
VREPRIDHALDGGFRGTRDRRTAKANTSGKQAAAHGNLPEVNAQSSADAFRMQLAGWMFSWPSIPWRDASRLFAAQEKHREQGRSSR